MFLRVTAGLALLSILSLGPIPDAGGQESQDGELRLLNDDGFGNPNNIGFDRIAAEAGYLFVGTANTEEGMMVYRSKDGVNFEAISDPGIDGNLKNNYLVGFGWFQDKLYVTSWDIDQLLNGEPPIGFGLFRANAAAEDPDDIVWETITTDGFGHPSDQAAGGFRVFDGHLYMGTFNHYFTENPPSKGTDGALVYRTATGDPDDWTPVSPRGFDNPECTTDAHHSFVHDGHLYYTTEKFACPMVSATKIWRTDGVGIPHTWEAINEEGFGRPYNNNSLATVIMDDNLFVATWGYGAGTEVWRANLAEAQEVPFENWEQVNETGFGNPQNMWTNHMVELDGTIYLGGMDPFTTGRGYIYKNSDPLGSASDVTASWEEITGEGWPPPEGPSSGIYEIAVFDGKVYFAHHSGNYPGQLWVYEPAATTAPTPTDTESETAAEPEPGPETQPGGSETEAESPLPSTGGGLALAGALLLAVSVAMARRRVTSSKRSLGR